MLEQAREDLSELIDVLCDDGFENDEREPALCHSIEGLARAVRSVEQGDEVGSVRPGLELFTDTSPVDMMHFLTIGQVLSRDRNLSALATLCTHAARYESSNPMVLNGLGALALEAEEPELAINFLESAQRWDSQLIGLSWRMIMLPSTSAYSPMESDYLYPKCLSHCHDEVYRRRPESKIDALDRAACLGSMLGLCLLAMDEISGAHFVPSTYWLRQEFSMLLSDYEKLIAEASEKDRVESLESAADTACRNAAGRAYSESWRTLMPSFSQATETIKAAKEANELADLLVPRDLPG